MCADMRKHRPLASFAGTSVAGLLDADKQGVLSVVFYQKPLAAEALRSQINPLIPEHALDKDHVFLRYVFNLA